MSETSDEVSVKYGDLSEILIEHNDVHLLYGYIKTKFDLNDNNFELYRHEIDVFVKAHNFRWFRKSKGRSEHFKTQYAPWLDQDFVLKNPSIVKRKLKQFNECSARTKRRRMEQVCQNNTQEEIEGAFFINLRENCDEIDAEIINNLPMASLTTKELIMKILRGDFVPFSRYTPDEALALMVDLKLTKWQYDVLHIQAKKKNADLYPPYSHVVDAKKRCYPASIDLSDYGAKINLQSLVDHTTQRLIQSCDTKLLDELAEPRLKVIYKWGLDGASGQSNYKQVFQNDNGSSSDESVFMISMMPLQVKSSDLVIWKNPHPSSTKYCRPIRFDFMKEDRMTTNQLFDEMQTEIADLDMSSVDSNGNEVIIDHKFFSTMVDGKVVNNLTDTSDSNCNICDAKPTEMNNHELLKTKYCNKDNYCFGLSTLHCWIRFLVALLHIAYKLPIKKYKTSNEEEKQIVAETKKSIQKVFKLEKGFFFKSNLIVENRKVGFSFVRFEY